MMNPEVERAIEQERLPSGRFGPVALSAQDRIMSKVVVVENCWHWTGAIGRSEGYGSVYVDGRNRPAHRVSYEAFRGPIPDGLVIDHLCRNRDCVNPWHLEPVTERENILRGAGVAAEFSARPHCSRGHEYDPSDTYIDKDGSRVCQKCRRHRAYVARKNAEEAK